MSEILRIDKVCFCYRDGDQVLEDISFTAAPGGLTALLGKRGSGKSTLIRLIANLLSPSSGRITLFGRDSRELDASVKRRIGILSCHNPLIDFLNVDEHLGYVGRLYGMDRSALRKRISRLKDIFGPDEFMERPNAELSASRRKKVGILTTLIHSPEFLAWDEPFRDLDPADAGRLEELIASLHKKGATILLSAGTMADRTVLSPDTIGLKEGRLVCSEYILAARAIPDAKRREGA